MTALGAPATASRLVFAADLERRGFVPGAGAGEYVGRIETEVGPKRISVRLGNAFPYRKPAVIPLDPGHEAGHEHQGPNGGGLCLWPEEGTGWEPGTSANELLARAARWFEHDARGDWGPEDSAPDADRLFAAGHDLLLYDSDWPPSPGAYGHFVVWTPSTTSNPRIAGRPQVGDARPSRHGSPDLAAIVLPGTLTAHDAIWMRLRKLPRIEQQLGSFLRAIDEVRAEPDASLPELVRTGHGGKERELYLALGYPDPDGRSEERWLVVHSKIPRGTRAGDYDAIVVEAFEAAPADAVGLRRRLPPEHLGLYTKRVLILGCGAIGSDIAIELAKSGVGHLGLIDSDKLRPGHVIRHGAPLIWVGMSKVAAIEGTIKWYVPSAGITAVKARSWDPLELSGVIGASDLVIDATATPAFTMLLADLCTGMRRPLLAAYALRQAEVGLVRLYRPGTDPCPYCFEFRAEPGWVDPRIPRRDDAEFYETGCADPTSVAAAADVVATANVAARIALRLLADQWDARNQALVVNAAVPEGPEPLEREGVHFASNQRGDGCHICSRAE